MCMWSVETGNKLKKVPGVEEPYSTPLESGAQVLTGEDGQITGVVKTPGEQAQAAWPAGKD